MTHETISPEESYQRLYQKALGLLARREHAELEICQKLAPLAKRLSSSGQIEAVINALIEEGYLNNQRYAEMLVRTRYDKGHGPLRVRQELAHKGLGSHVTEQVLEAFEGDWFELARSVKLRRFGDDNPQDPKIRAKQMRFLGGRGFTSDQIRYAFEATEFEG